MSSVVEDTHAVIVSAPTPNLRVLTFNRPAKRNALSQDLIRQLLVELSHISTDKNVRAVVLTGNGSVFSGIVIPIEPRPKQGDIV
jgi:enoyl-CoA hydratase